MPIPGGIVDRSSFAWALAPAVASTYQKNIDDREFLPDYIPVFFKEGEMTGATKEFLSGLTGVGTLQPTDENQPTKYATPGTGRPVKYKAEKLTLGIRISYEAKADMLIDIIGEAATMLAMAAQVTPQLDAALVYALGAGDRTAGKSWGATDWSSATQTYLGADGTSLFSTTHSIEGTALSHRGILTYANTWSNYLSGVGLTDTGYQQASALLRRTPDPQGQPMGLRSEILWVPTDLEETANQLMAANTAITSPYSAAANANSGVPSLIGSSRSKVVVWDRLPDQNMWGLKSSSKHPSFKIRFLWREKPQRNPLVGYDFDTDCAKYKVRTRYTAGYDAAYGVVAGQAS